MRYASEGYPRNIFAAQKNGITMVQYWSVVKIQNNKLQRMVEHLGYIFRRMFTEHYDIATRC